MASSLGQFKWYFSLCSLFKVTPCFVSWFFSFRWGATLVRHFSLSIWIMIGKECDSNSKRFHSIKHTSLKTLLPCLKWNSGKSGVFLHHVIKLKILGKTSLLIEFKRCFSSVYSSLVWITEFSSSKFVLD